MEQKRAASWHTDYLSYEELSCVLEQWQRDYPDLIELRSLTTTAGGREVWMLVVGRDRHSPRPAVWVDGGMHATELAGTNVAMILVESLLALHQGESVPALALPEHTRDTLRDTLFYVVPRVSPDGAEQAITTGGFVRSHHSDTRTSDSRPHWVASDIDGDGKSLMMRRLDPAGDFVESPEVKNLMVPRQLEDAGPTYRLYPEGIIENFDGFHIPSAPLLSTGDVDFNRNFPSGWAPNSVQLGSGPLPLSEPETRAIAEFIASTPHIFAVLNLHTFGGVVIRPPMHGPDTCLAPKDLALYRQLEDWALTLTGYPTVSGFEGFSPQPGKPVHGSFLEFTWSHGCLSYVTELWDIFAELGMESPERFVDLYAQLSRAQLTALGRWDAELNEGRAVAPWVAHEHPQLGRVEVGGVNPMVGIWNPPPERLHQIGLEQVALLSRVACMAPKLVIREMSVTPLSADVTHFRIQVANTGYLSTHFTEQRRKARPNLQLEVSLEPLGAQIHTPSIQRFCIDDLDGWGRGLYGECSALYEQASRGGTHQHVIDVIASGHGTIIVRIGNPQIGFVQTQLELPNPNHPITLHQKEPTHA